MRRNRMSVDEKTRNAEHLPRHLSRYPVRVFGGVTQLDPNNPTYLATLQPGWTYCGRVDGKWSPGPNFPYYGPGGDPNTMFGSFHKFSCVIVPYDQQTNEPLPQFATEDDPQCGFAITNLRSGNIFIAAVMNDDSGNNINNPQDPMRVTFQYEGPGNCPDC